MASLGERTAAATSFDPIIRRTGVPRNDTPVWIRLSDADLQPPDPDVEEATANEMNAHHVALSYLVNYLKMEVDEDVPVVASAWARVWESIKHLFHPATPSQVSALSAAQRYEHAQEIFPLFLKQQKEKAIPILAKIIGDENLPKEVRLHAARALGEHIGRRFHRERDPLASAKNWLTKHK